VGTLAGNVELDKITQVHTRLRVLPSGF